MNNLINNINQTIADKCNQLKDEVNMGLSSITLPNSLPSVSQNDTRQTATPPISYILYGLAGLSAIGALSITGFRIIGLGIAAVSAYGGYRLASSSGKPDIVTGNPMINIESLKNDVSAKVISLLRKMTGEWDDFMQLTKNNIQDAINQSTLESNQKEEMMNKIFIHEVFDISMADFNSRMNVVSTVAELKSLIEAFRSKLMNAIDATGKKQIQKYNSLLDHLCNGRELSLS